jgi:hypothetical protein
MSVTGHLSETSALPAPGDTAAAGDRAYIKLAAKFRQENKGEILRKARNFVKNSEISLSRNCTNFIGKFREIQKKNFAKFRLRNIS